MVLKRTSKDDLVRSDILQRNLFVFLFSSEARVKKSEIIFQTRKNSYRNWNSDEIGKQYRNYIANKYMYLGILIYSLLLFFLCVRHEILLIQLFPLNLILFNFISKHKAECHRYHSFFICNSIYTVRHGNKLNVSDVMVMLTRRKRRQPQFAEDSSYNALSINIQPIR